MRGGVAAIAVLVVVGAATGAIGKDSSNQGKPSRPAVEDVVLGGLSEPAGVPDRKPGALGGSGGESAQAEPSKEGEKVDNPEEYKGDPIPGGPTDPDAPKVAGEKDLTNKDSDDDDSGEEEPEKPDSDD